MDYKYKEGLIRRDYEVMRRTFRAIRSGNYTPGGLSLNNLGDRDVWKDRKEYVSILKAVIKSL